MSISEGTTLLQTSYTLSNRKVISHISAPMMFGGDRLEVISKDYIIDVSFHADSLGIGRIDYGDPSEDRVHVKLVNWGAGTTGASDTYIGTDSEGNDVWVRIFLQVTKPFPTTLAVVHVTVLGTK